MGILDGILGIGNLLLGGAQTASNYKAQKAANETNIKLQKTQLAWEENMANTAVQRRRADIEAAGGNPALAFTNGSEASTPVVAPARVEPTKLEGLEAMTTALQLALLKAQTKSVTADARIKNVEADIREGLRDQELGARKNRFIEQIDWDDAKTQIMRNQIYTSAAERRRIEGTVDAAIAQAKQQAEMGKLDLESAKRIAENFGLNPSSTATFLRIITDLLRTISK